MNAVELIKSKGLKKTAQRIMLITILQKSDVSLTENDIKTEMGELYDRITFYRTVQTLLDVNIIHRITVDNITVKYALNDAHYHDKPESHVHFFCKKCHSITCLKNMPKPAYKLPEGFDGTECELLIKGICSSCKAKSLHFK